jgi:hypothetical protein
MNSIQRNISYFGLIVMAMLFLNSCNKENLVEPEQPKVEETSNGILPLKVGYYWKYKNYYLKEDGSIANEDLEDEYMITKSSSINVNNESYIVFHRIYGYLDPVIAAYRYGIDEWLFRNFDNGIYQMGGKYKTDSIYTKLIWYKYPVRKGETWKSPHLTYYPIEAKYMIADSITFTCTDTNAVFETPLGNFNCVVYYHREKQDEDVAALLDIYEYYSYGIGLVGRKIYSYFPFDQKSYPKSKRLLYETNVITNKN